MHCDSLSLFSVQRLVQDGRDLWYGLVAHTRVLLSQLVEKLVMRREDMEKELETMGKAPKGIKDIFHQCRGFEKAFTIAVDVRCPRPSQTPLPSAPE